MAIRCNWPSMRPLSRQRSETRSSTAHLRKYAHTGHSFPRTSNTRCSQHSGQPIEGCSKARASARRRSSRFTPWTTAEVTLTSSSRTRTVRWHPNRRSARYTLTAAQYCEWIVYATRNNLDGPGLTNEAPQVTDHCTRVTSKDGQVVFAPPGEGVESRFDKDGFTAIIPGQFVDRWRKVR